MRLKDRDREDNSEWENGTKKVFRVSHGGGGGKNGKKNEMNNRFEMTTFFVLVKMKIIFTERKKIFKIFVTVKNSKFNWQLLTQPLLIFTLSLTFPSPKNQLKFISRSNRAKVPNRNKSEIHLWTFQQLSNNLLWNPQREKRISKKFFVKNKTKKEKNWERKKLLNSKWK